MKYKILFLIDHLGSGGGQRQIVNLAIGMKNAGYEVEMAVYFAALTHYKHLIEEADIPLNILPKNKKYSPKVLFGLIRLVKQKQFQLMVSFLDTPNVYAELAGIRTGIKCIVAERSSFPKDLDKVSVKRKIQCRLHVLANHVITNSHYHKERLLQLFPKLRGKTSVLYNTVDKSIINIANIDRTGSEINPLLCVASVTKNKNPRVLIKAVHLIKQKYGLTLQVNWAGAVNALPEHRIYFEECQQIIKEFQLQEQWRWLGECKDVGMLYSTHNVLIHPSFLEGLPNAICEAMAAGLIPLASNVCEHPILLSEWKEQLLFDPSDPEDLADKLFHIYQMNNQQRAEMSLGLSNKAKRLFEEKIIIEQFRGIVNKACISS